MTDLRIAAQQALEALEEYQSKGAPFLACDGAAAALRAALAQQDEPVQEPVAWLYEAGADRTLHWNKPPLYGTPLYLAPPQHKPLTNDRVWLEYMQLWPFRPNEEPTLAKDILRFARAIERAHGIVTCGDTKERA